LLFTTDSMGKMAVCLLILSIRFPISVVSASKKAIYFLILPLCLLISVHRALILVFSASKKALCFLKLRFAYSFQSIAHS